MRFVTEDALLVSVWEGAWWCGDLLGVDGVARLGADRPVALVNLVSLDDGADSAANR